MLIIQLFIYVSSGSLILLPILHQWAGIQAYVKGKTLDVFDTWIPETSKQDTLLGVFFMIFFPWLFVEIINIVMITGYNSIGPWLGWLNIMSKLPQLILLFIYVDWNRLAQILYGLNILAWIIWLVTFST